jgi:WD40 repeat protein
VRSSARARWGWWELSMPQGLRTFDCGATGDPNFHVDFSPDGQTLSLLRNDELRLLDLGSGEPRLVAPIKNGRTAYFTSDGHSLLTCANNRVTISPLELVAEAGSALRLGQSRELAAIKAGHLDGITLSQDRRQMALLASDSDMALMDLDNPARQILFSGADKPAMPALSPDRKWLVSGTFHGRGSTVWDAVTGRKVLELERGNSNPCFSPCRPTARSTFPIMLLFHAMAACWPS